MVIEKAGDSASEVINVKTSIVYTKQYLHTLCIGLLVSSISSLYNPSFAIERTNSDSDPNAATSNSLSRPITVFPTGGLPRFWLAQYSGSHKLYDANNGALLSPEYIDGLTTYSRAQQLVGLDKGYLGLYGSGNSQHVNLQNSGSSYTFSLIISYTTALPGTRAAMQITGTNFIIRSHDNNCDKLNFDTQTVAVDFKSANPSKSWYTVGYPIIEEIPSTSTFYASMRYPLTYVMDRTTLVIQREWIRPTDLTNNYWYSFRLDNINSHQNLYILDDYVDKFFKFDQTTNPLTLLGEFAITGAGGLGGFIQNFGPLQFVFSVLMNQPSSFNSSLMMLTKSTPIQQVDVIVPFTSTVHEYASAAYYDIAQEKLLFSISTSNTPLLFQTYKLSFKVCITRDHTNTCTECVPGYYLSDANPNNQCWLKQDFPPGVGANDPSKYVEPCTLANCDDCRDNYAVCFSCKNTFYWTESSGGISRCLVDGTDLPIAGRGKNGTKGYLPPCTAPGCVSCAANYQVCTACDPALYFTESPPGTITGCYNYAGIPTTHGINGASKLLNTCAVSSCSDCKDNFNICLDCISTHYYTENHPGTKTNCYASAAIPDGYGKNGAAQKLEFCSLAGCLKCVDSYTTCTNCQSTLWYKEADPAAKTECYDNSARPIPDGFGIDGSNKLLKACDLNTCKVCSANYNTCTECPADRWYTATPITACYLTSEIPAGKGKNAGTQLLNDCLLSKCNECRDSFSTCNSCETTPTMTYYAEETGPKGKCYVAGNIPSGRGIDGSNQLLKPCSVANCYDCKADFNVCQACPAYTWYKESTGPKANCYLSYEIPDMFGKQTSTQVLAACSTTDCLKCVENNAQCTDCQSDRYFVEATGIKTNCYTTSNVPSGKGIDGTNKLLKDCSVANCDDCKADFNTCQSCLSTPTKFYYTESTGAKSNCYAAASIPTGYGINGANQLLSSCTVSGCDDCKTDHSQCNSCISTRWINEASPPYTTCYEYSSIPDGWGKDNSNQLLKACSDVVGCQVCKATYQGCETCKNTHWYVETLGNKVCYLEADIPSGYGKDGSNKKLLECTSYGCISCAANKDVCLACRSDLWYLPSGVGVECYNDTTIPNKYGKNGALKLLESCNDTTNCKVCKADKNYCTECVPGWIDIDGICVVDIPGPRKPGLKSITYDTFDGNIHFAFEPGFTKAQLVDIVSTIRIKAYIDSSGNRVDIPKERQIPLVKFTDDGFALSVNMPEANSRVSLILDGGKSGYLAREVQVNDIVYTSEQSWLPGILLAMSISLTITRLVSNFGMSYFHRRLSVRLDKIVADTLCLLLLSGEFLGYPSYVMRRFIRFHLINPWDNGSDFSNGCKQTHTSLDRKDVDCNILGNFGEDLLVIYVTLFISVVIHIAGTIKKQSSTFSSFAGTFGLGFWMQRMDAIFLQVLIYCFIQMKYTDSGKQTAQLVGYCLTLLVYYLIVSVAKVVVTLKMINKYRQGPSGAHMNNGMMSWVFADYNHPTQAYQLLLPVVTTVRNILLAVVVVFSLDNTWVQAVICLVIELSYLLFILKANIKSSKLERILDYVSSSLFLIFILLIMGSNIKQVDLGRQNGWGAVVMIIVVAFGLINFAFVLFSMSNAIYNWFKKPTSSDETSSPTPVPRNDAFERPEKRKKSAYRVEE